MKSNNIFYRTIIVLVYLAISFSIYGQNTRTPKNQYISLTNNTDTPAWINTWDSLALVWIDINDSEAVKVGAATSHYNCHAYAWHIVDGGDDENSWMHGDILGLPNVAKYWTNDAYSTTSSAYKGGYKKIYYGEDADHSAIPINAYGKVRSKWAKWGLYEHDLADCPFSDGATYTYYSIPLNGDDIVCNSETYSTVNINGATYNWSGSKVSTSGSGYSTTATKTSDGQGNVQVDISSTYSGTTVTASKDVWVGRPDPNDFIVYVEELYGDPVEENSDEQFELCEGEQYYISLYPYFLFDDQGITDVEFDFTFDYHVLDEGDDYIEIEVDFSPEDEEGEVYVTTDCGYYTLKFMDFVEGDCGGYFMMMSPNPATSETTVTLQTTNVNEPIDENIEWEIEVYSPTQILKETKNKLKGKAHKIQTNGWKAGVYIVRAKYKDKIIPGKLLVQD